MFRLSKIHRSLVVVGCALASLSPHLWAGAEGGAKYGIHRVAAHSYDVFYVAFWRNEQAIVALSGDGDTDIDVYVYDEYNRLVASDTGPSDQCRVVWYPRSGGTYRIVVENLGSVYNEYEIATN